MKTIETLRWFQMVQACGFSSTSTLYTADRLTQNALWGPVQYDLGLKWVRVGYDLGMYTWCYVEQEKGKLQVDPISDKALRELKKNGIKIVLNLDVKANWIYLDPPRKQNWEEARYREIDNVYFDHPGWAWDTPEMMEGYLGYVRYMAKKYKDVADYFELGNEFKYQKDIYLKILEPVKSIYPRAKIMLCSDFPIFLDILKDLQPESGKKKRLSVFPDAVGWHPTTKVDYGLYPTDHVNYFKSVTKFIDDCKALGYQGSFFATEVYSWTTYPPGPPDGHSEMQRAKYHTQTLVGHNGLGVYAFHCNPISPPVRSVSPCFVFLFPRKGQPLFSPTLLTMRCAICARSWMAGRTQHFLSISNPIKICSIFSSSAEAMN